jgi:plasmid stabilization system protein ParE
MAFRVEVSESADNDLDAILTYITEELASPRAASDFADELDEKYERLVDHPFMFELSRNERLAKMGYRRFVVGNYVALYLVDEKECIVTISRLFYGKKDYEKHI